MVAGAGRRCGPVVICLAHFGPCAGGKRVSRIGTKLPACDVQSHAGHRIASGQSMRKARASGRRLRQGQCRVVQIL